MAVKNRFRLYALLEATPTLKEIYSSENLRGLTKYTRWRLRESPYTSSQFATGELIESFVAVGAPSKDWTPNFAGTKGGFDSPEPDEFVVALGFEDRLLQRRFVDLVADGLSLSPSAPIRQVGVDIGVSSADHWCPGQGVHGMLGHRDDANRIVNASALGRFRGRHVNVVIVDEGLDSGTIPAANWGGGLDWAGTVAAGTADRKSHGMMIARSILDLAPEAKLYDVPLLPKRIANIPAFLSQADTAYQTILAYIARHRNDNAQLQGPWIFVNAWAIFDRATEGPAGLTLGDYTENRRPGGHPLINRIRSVVQASGFDVVFSAGNCGQFCFSPRCGQQDRGPRNSIWGANALPEVVTVGSVRTDAMWSGYSSQGPGPGTPGNNLAVQKPDLCAPSNFCETRDAYLLNSGSSTACAMTAGVVAALRSNPAWNQARVSPTQMRDALRRGARKTHGLVWNGRFGEGILDVSGTIAHL